MEGWLVYTVAVALLWGTTNPFMRQGGKGIKNEHGFINELIYLFTNWKYTLPFLLNQLGSVLFLQALGSAGISVVIPLTNALTFVITAITGYYLCEDVSGKRIAMGLPFVLIGVALCTAHK